MHFTLICIGLFLFAAALATTTGAATVIPKPTSRPAPELRADGTLLLVGGNWKVQSASLVSSSAEQIARADFDDREWVPATVPGTVLSRSTQRS